MRSWRSNRQSLSRKRRKAVSTLYSKDRIVRLEKTRRRTIWSAEATETIAKLPQKGIFLTAVQGSDPSLTGRYRDQLIEAHDFYRNYEARLENLAVIGIEWLQFGPSYFEIHRNANQTDFGFVDHVMTTCKDQKITVIADLLHVSLADWLTGPRNVMVTLEDPNFPIAFAKYAKVFAKRYPQIHYFTLIHEPYQLAKLILKEDSTHHTWCEDLRFITLVSILAKATILARKAIEHVWIEEHRSSEPVFFQSERFVLSTAKPGSNREAEAKCFNLCRFAPLDLIVGHHDTTMESYLGMHGLSQAHYDWFMAHGSNKQTILALNHAPDCIETLEPDGAAYHDTPYPQRLYELIGDYWARYPLPLLHIELNAATEGSVAQCQNIYNLLQNLRQAGKPIVGFGWYNIEYQSDSRVTPRALSGLFHEAELQPIGERFAKLAETGLVATKPGRSSSEAESTLSVQRRKS